MLSGTMAKTLRERCNSMSRGSSSSSRALVTSGSILRGWGKNGNGLYGWIARGGDIMCLNVYWILNAMDTWNIW